MSVYFKKINGADPEIVAQIGCHYCVYGSHRDEIAEFLDAIDVETGMAIRSCVPSYVYVLMTDAELERFIKAGGLRVTYHVQFARFDNGPERFRSLDSAMRRAEELSRYDEGLILVSLDRMAKDILKYYYRGEEFYRDADVERRARQKKMSL